MKKNTTIEHAFAKLSSVHLSEAEKASMSMALFAHMRANPLPGRAVRSPFVAFFGAIRFHPVLSLFLAALIGLSTGTAGAWSAESTLPGDFLYPLKTKVSEPLVRVMGFANSVQGKVNYEWSLVEKRLLEAEKLASDRKLEAQSETMKQAILAQRIKALQTAKKLLAEGTALPDATATETATLSMSARSAKAPTPQAHEHSSKAAVTKTHAFSTAAVPVAPIPEVDITEVRGNAATGTPVTSSQETYPEAAKKIDDLFIAHQGVVNELGLKLDLPNGRINEARPDTHDPQNEPRKEK